MKTMNDKRIHLLVEDMLPLYCDDLLNSENRQLVEDHLKECPECRKQLTALQQTDLEEQDHDIPVPHSGEVFDQIRRRRRRMTGAISICLLCIAVLLGLLAQRSKPVPLSLFQFDLQMSQEDERLQIRLEEIIQPDSAGEPSGKSFVMKEERKNGVLNLLPYAAENGLLQTVLDVDTAGLKEIRLGRSIIWQNGEIIPPGLDAAYTFIPDAYPVGQEELNRAMQAIYYLGGSSAYQRADSRISSSTDGFSWIFTLPDCVKTPAGQEQYSCAGKKSMEYLQTLALLMLGLPDGPTSVTFEIPRLDTSRTWNESDLYKYGSGFIFPYSSVSEMARFADALGWQADSQSLAAGSAPKFACSVFEPSYRLINKTGQNFSTVSWKLQKGPEETAFQGQMADFAANRELQISGIGADGTGLFEDPKTVYTLQIYGPDQQLLAQTELHAYEYNIELCKEGSRFFLEKPVLYQP